MKKASKAIIRYTRKVSYILILAVLLLVGVIHSVWFQSLLGDYAGQFCSEWTGNEVYIGKLEFSLFQKTVKIRDLRISDRRSKPLLNAEYVHLKLSSFNFKNLDIAAATLYRPIVHIVRYKGDSASDFKNIIDKLSALSTDTVSSGNLVIIRQVKLEKGEFVYADHNIAEKADGTVDFKHVDVPEFTAEVKNLMIFKGNVYGTLVFLDAKEKSGVDIKKLRANVVVASDSLVIKKMELKFNATHLFADVSFSFSDYSSFKDFATKIKMDIDVKPSSYVRVSDVGYFVKEMQNTNVHVDLSGEVHGVLRNIRAKNLKIRGGEQTNIEADIEWDNFPKFVESEIHADIRKLYVKKSDLAAIKQLDINKYKLPAFVLKLEYGELSGTFDGDLRKFNTRLSLLSNLGQIDVDIHAIDTLKNQKFFEGLVSAKALNIGLIAGMPDFLGRVNADLYVSALGKDYVQMHYTLDGSISDLEMKGKTLETLYINCQTHTNYFHGGVSCKDTNLSFEFDGLLDYERNVPLAQYDLNLHRVDLRALGLMKDTVPFEIKGQIYSKYNGRNLDDFFGSFNVDNLYVKRNDKDFYISSILLNTQTLEGKRKKTEVIADFMKMEIEGIYTVTQFPTLYKELLAQYIPGMRKDDSLKKKNRKENIQSFDLSFSLNKFQDPRTGKTAGINNLLELFLPSLQVDENLRMYIKYHAPEHIYSLDLETEYVSFGSILCTGGKIKAHTAGSDKLNVSVFAEMLYLNDSIHLDKFNVSTEFNGQDTVNWSLNWLNQSDSTAKIRSMGKVMGQLDFSQTKAVCVNIRPSYFVFSGSPWLTYPDASIVLEKGKYVFNNIGLRAENRNESVLLQGEWSSDESSELNLSFNSFDMNYLNFFTRKTGMEMDADISGNIKIGDPMHRFEFIADIVLKNFLINGGEYGNAILKTSFSKGDEKIKGLLAIGRDNEKPYLHIDGYYNAKMKNLDFSGELSNMPIHFLSSYLNSFASGIDGSLSGPIKFGGPLEKLKWKGLFTCENMALTINMLQTRYEFSGLQLSFTPTEIAIKKGKFKDVQYGTSGELGGKITYKYFDKLALDLHASFSNMLVLNTAASKEEVYYGRVFATGGVDITGPLEAIHIGVKARTEKDSHITFDFSSTASTSQSNFITFYKPEIIDTTIFNPKNYVKSIKKEIEKEKLTLDLGLEITPSLRVGLDIRNVTMNGTLSAFGRGSMRMLVRPEGVQLFGTYVVSNGTFDFSMVDLINKRFSLKDGGTIAWTGPMNDARININAAYTTRTSLFPVLASSGLDENMLKKKVTVESIISLKGKLMNPDIGFDINLVNAEEDVKDLFYSYVNKENEDEMIKQTFSLLMMNSFMSAGDNAAGPSLSSNALVSSSELLFNQFNNFLSHLSSNFNLGMNYTPASESNNSEFQVMMSGQLFDDRLSIEGNIGVSEADKATAKTASTIVGDVNVEWKFTEQLRLKAFNRSNEKDLTRPGTSYTQGVGFVFRRDFDTLKELFSRIGPSKAERQEKRKQKKEAKREAKKE